MILVTAKVNPDLDGVACIYAYGEFLRNQGKSVVGGIFGKPSVETEYLINRFEINDLVFEPKDDWSKFVLVDASDTKGMPDVLRSDDVIEVIDHRNVYEPEKTFPNAKIQNEAVGAATTLITEKYQQSASKISRSSTLLLYCAIYSNTLNMRAAVTTKRDKKAVEWLSFQTEIPNNLIYDMFLAKSTESVKNLRETLVESDFKGFVFGKTSFGITQLEALNIDQIVNDYYEQIVRILEDLKEKFNLDFVFLTAVDLEKGFNLFVTPHLSGQKILSEIFNIKFVHNVARRPGFILRKEIIPLLREKLG